MSASLPVPAAESTLSLPSMVDQMTIEEPVAVIQESVGLRKALFVRPMHSLMSTKNVKVRSLTPKQCQKDFPVVNDSF